MQTKAWDEGLYDSRDLQTQVKRHTFQYLILSISVRSTMG